MKKLIALCAIVSVATAFAEDNVFGCLRVDSSAEQTIVAVPWVAAGVAAGEIKVADIVKTANLHEGDTLKWYNNETKAYESWELGENGWEPIPSVTTPGEVSEAEDSTKQALSRGDALLLIRNAPIATCFYLYGQVPTPTTPVAEMTLGVGTATAPCYTLIAPPSVVETDLNKEGIVWSNVGKNDQIILSDAATTVLSYDTANSKWGRAQKKFVPGQGMTTTYDTTKANIAPGIGAWYISKGGGEAAPKVQW